MKILFYYYRGGGGGLSNLTVLLGTMAQRYQEDFIDIVTSRAVDFRSLETLPNIRVRSVKITGMQEIDRLLLGVSLLRRVARNSKADVLWSVNLGPYFRPPMASVISVNNPHQVYPWKMSRYHPRSRAHVAAMRFFFRRALAAADGVIVQTPLMAEYVRDLSGRPHNICIAPKAVEGDGDVRFESLPRNVAALLRSSEETPAFTFLYVATLSPHKNHVTVMRAAAELARRRRHFRLVLTLTREEVLGIGCPQSRFLIDDGYVVPVGWVSKRHVKSLYMACDACVMPSVVESLSSAHLEAMQWGRAQLAADLPYARQLCGAAALYVPAEEPRAWVGGMERLMNDESLRSVLVSAGRERMRRYPATWNDVAATVHAFLASTFAASMDSKSGIASATQKRRM